MTRTRTGIGWLATPALMALLVNVAAAQQNVARERPYTVSSDVMDGWTGLVDGVTDSDSAPGCFATGNGKEFPKAVTINLERPCNINRVAIHNSANGNTRGIVIYCSDDGVQYEKLREFIFPQNNPLTLNHRFNDRSAQFVRVEFSNTWGGGLGGENTIFCREVEVFGSPTGGAPVVEPVEDPSGDPLIATRDLRLFRRWALRDDGQLTMAVLGDSLASCEEQTWPQLVAERLALARPEEAEVSVTAMTEEGLAPSPSLGYISLTAEAEPDIVFVTFGTDLEDWDQVTFRAGLSALLNRLLEETDALIVLVAPVATGEEQVIVGRHALREMERLADVFSVPVVRTEAALLQSGLSVTEAWNGEGELTRQARDTIATIVLELLLQPQI